MATPVTPSAPPAASGTVVVTPSAPPAASGTVVVAPAEPSVSGTVVMQPEVDVRPPAVVVVPTPPEPPQGVVVVEQQPSTEVAPSSVASESFVESPPRKPGHGSLQLGYAGGHDGVRLVHGGFLRFAGTIEDIWEIELTFGARGGSWNGSTLVWDVPILLMGVRAIGVVVEQALRFYGVVATGGVLRTLGEDQHWGQWTTQIGGALEAGVPVDEHASVGGYLDVRAELRLPLERESPAFGVVGSTGFALTYY